MGRENTLVTPTARLLLVGQRYGLNAGLIFWRVLGLRDSRDLTRRDIDGPHATAWSRTEFQDAGGQVYRELAVSDLMRHPDFIAVGR
jgi:twitching motility protein PilI